MLGHILNKPERLGVKFSCLKFFAFGKQIKFKHNNGYELIGKFFRSAKSYFHL